MNRKMSVKVKNVELGVGMPKICVSITGKTVEDILEQAREIKKNPVDIAEWRVDFYEDVMEREKVLSTLKQLTEVIEELPVLFTFRRKAEGGEKDISLEDYKALNISVIKSGMTDLVDVELFAGDELVSEVVEEAHKNQVKVVISNHDFAKTPEREELVRRLCKMQEPGICLR